MSSTVAEWFYGAKQSVISPSAYFSSVRHVDGYGQPFVFALMSGLISGFFTSIIAVLLTGAFSTDGLIFVVGGIVGGGIGMVVATALLALITHALLFLMGVHGLGRTLKTYWLATGIPALLGWIPLVNIAALFYILYVHIIGLATMHDISRKRPAIAVLLPFIVLLLLTVGAVATLFGTQLLLQEQTDAMNQEMEQQMQCSNAVIRIQDAQFADTLSTAVIMNSGSVAVSDIQVTFYQGDQQVGQKTVPGLSAGQGQEVQAIVDATPDAVEAALDACPDVSDRFTE